MNTKQFAYGLILAAVIYGLIIISYVTKKQYWALGPYFTFPFFMFIVPFLFALITNKSHNKTLLKLSTSLYISIIFSGLYFIIFNDFAFGILERLGIEKHY